MEIYKSTIQRGESHTYLVLTVNQQELKITLTDDNPNNVKGVFNRLLKELKRGIFKFELDDNTQDLYHHICDEYIKQLNVEIDSVYKELSEFSLLES